MEAERWRKIEALYYAAVDLDEGKRGVFLDSACEGDEQLRSEIDSLLTYDEEAGRFIESPAMELAAKSIAHAHSTTAERVHASGTVSHYKLIEKIGRGGMGVVYKAEDTKLRRFVALKFLPEELSRDPRALARFRREARAASALDHPNICTVYEIGEEDGEHFIAMQFLEGQTLRQFISGKALNIGTLVDLAIQMADALDAAHLAGIVHRDFKPANIFITNKGQVKILDFGIAKRQVSSASVALAPSHLPESSPDSECLTNPGAFIGTVAYMSPEQARGQDVDSRTDLFGFGAVLYEMATGQHAFCGKTMAVVFHAVLDEVPSPPSQVNPELPPELDRIINRLLEKDRAQRYQSAADLCSELKRLRRDTDSDRSAAAVRAGVAGVGHSRQEEQKHSRGAHAIGGEAPAPPRRWPFRVGAAALIVAAVLAFQFRPTLPPPKVTGSTRVTNDDLEKELMVTDGSRIYFSSVDAYNYSLYEASTAGGDTLPFQRSIPHAILTLLSDISPDRSELLVGSCTSLYQDDCPLWALPVLGRPPRRLGTLRASFTAGAATWSPDGKEIACARGNSLYRARIDGTESRKIANLAQGMVFYWPRWSPDGSRLRFSVTPDLLPTMNDQNPRSSLWEVSADGKNLRRLFSGWNNPSAECCGSWTANGKYFLFQALRGGIGNIWAIREGGSPLRKVSHEPVQLTTGPLSTYAPVPSPDSRKVFVVTAQVRGELVRYDSRSHEFSPYLSGIPAMALDFSRDGKWMTYVAYPEGTLWRSKLDGTERLQLTFPPFFAFLPHWSPDATHIAFIGREPAKPFRVYVIPAEGGNPERPVPQDRDTCDPTWSPDGNSLVFGRFPSDEPPGIGPMDLEILDMRTHVTASVPGSQELWSPRWSPDGGHISALSRTADRLMLFDLKTQKWTELAKIGVGYPVWSRKGDYIYFTGIPLGGQPSGEYRVRISDRKLEQLFSVKDLRQAPGWGEWMGLAPDDSPLVVRDTGTQDIYALDWEAP